MAKSKEKPGDTSSLQVERHVQTRESLTKIIKEKTSENLRQLRIDINASTLGARSGNDIPSLRQKRFEEIVEAKLFKQQKALLEGLNDMFASYDNKEDYAKFLDRVKAFMQKGEKNMNRLIQAFTYAIKCLAGYNGKIEVGDYAYFYTLLDNVSTLYDKNVKIGDILVAIKKDDLSKKDWDVICRNIRSKALKRTVQSAKDSIILSTSAFLVQLMNSHQRTQMLLEFRKRYGNKEAIKLVDQMVQTGAINLKQHTFVMSKITGSEYIRTQAEEKLIMERRRQAEMLTRHIRRNLYKPLAINGAERVLNRKSIGSLILTGIGVVGMITNYMAGLSTGKGVGKYFKGLKNPYFLISMGMTGLGVHALTGSLHPGKSVGALDKIVKKQRRIDNPFGAGDTAEQQDTQMKVLSGICANHKSMEAFLLDKETKGFDDIWGFYSKSQFNRKRLKSKMLTTAQRAKIKGEKRKGLYDEFLDYVEKERGNKRGAIRLKETKRLYGKAAVERMIFDITVSAYTLGIHTTAGFYRKTTGENVKYSDLFLYRQGLKSRPQAMLPKQKPKKQT
ncbi:hypothetical protein J7J83_01120 [bacterium]|nr:hypothetical protein [bacterium]